MRKAIHSQLSKIFCEHIRELRERAGLTQRELASLLNREHGMVARIELGERRVDFIEAYQLFDALGCDPIKESQVIMKKFRTADKVAGG